MFTISEDGHNDASEQRLPRYVFWDLYARSPAVYMLCTGHRERPVAADEPARASASCWRTIVMRVLPLYLRTLIE